MLEMTSETNPQDKDALVLFSADVIGRANERYYPKVPIFFGKIRLDESDELIDTKWSRMQDECILGRISPKSWQGWPQLGWRDEYHHIAEPLYVPIRNSIRAIIENHGGSVEFDNAGQELYEAGFKFKASPAGLRKIVDVSNVSVEIGPGTWTGGPPEVLPTTHAWMSLHKEVFAALPDMGWRLKERLRVVGERRQLELDGPPSHVVRAREREMRRITKESTDYLSRYAA